MFISYSPHKKFPLSCHLKLWIQQMQTLRFLLILVLVFSPDSFGNGQTQPKRRYTVWHTWPGGRGLRPTRYRPREEPTDYCDEVFDCLNKGVCKANPAKPCHCQFNECKIKSWKSSKQRSPTPRTLAKELVIATRRKSAIPLKPATAFTMPLLQE